MLFFLLRLFWRAFCAAESDAAYQAEHGPFTRRGRDLARRP